MDHYALKQKQSLPLPVKVRMSLSRINEALILCKDQAYVSFSGGRDSMVLLHLVHQVNHRIPVVFCDTGVEWPSVRALGLKYSTKVLKPSKPFAQIVRDYGYPAISKDVSQKLYEIRTTNSYTHLIGRLNGDIKGNGKLPEAYRYLISSDYKLSHKCCEFMKKKPFKKYEKEAGRVPFIGTMAADSRNRQTAYLDHGCNNFEEGARPTSSPMGFWTHKDVVDYVKQEGLEVASIYNKMEHTGCMYCLFGCAHQEFIKTEIIKSVSEKHYRYAKAVGMVEIEKYIGACGHPTLF